MRPLWLYIFRACNGIPGCTEHYLFPITNAIPGCTNVDLELAISAWTDL